MLSIIIILAMFFIVYLLLIYFILLYFSNKMQFYLIAMIDPDFNGHCRMTSVTESQIKWALQREMVKQREPQWKQNIL